ncbi:hypothetical protein DEO72_LG2g1651 [Vigna unguiculata]|uniref:Uncharacterized protein n=1 Tax=Vigna unguiculata TaxID=3917 RepID=A0A4D6KTD1_VIGUN|nr:hypothetical protein DEO72_LG2g1651 [Vigna unguiculata]
MFSATRSHRSTIPHRTTTAAPSNHHHRAFTLPSPSRVHLHAPKPRRLLLFNGGVFLLHQNGIHNVVVVPPPAATKATRAAWTGLWRGRR